MPANDMMMQQPAPPSAHMPDTELDQQAPKPHSVGFGHFRASTAPRISSHPLGAHGSLGGATPEDRQRAVAKILSRGESFSFSRDGDDTFELTPDKADSSPSGGSPRLAAVPVANSAPSQISFMKEEVAPVRPITSGLAGIHRPSQATGRPVIQTPNRYAVDTKPVVEQEFSSSGQRAKNRYKISVFLPTRDNDCVQVELKKKSTASEAVLQAVAQYLRSHSQPDPAMLGQPGAYRLRIAEDDGEIDDDCPPLDAGCVVSTTGENCFTLQKRAAPAPPVRPSGAAGGAAPAIAPASLAAPSAPRAQQNARIVSLMQENSQSDLFRDEEDPTAGGGRYRGSSTSRYLHDSSPPPVAPSGLQLRGSLDAGGSVRALQRKSHRTSSDADEDIAQLQAEREADEEEQRRIQLARANGARPLQPGMANSSARHSSPPAKSSRHFARFSLKACLSCSCFAATNEENESDSRPPPNRL